MSASGGGDGSNGGNGTSRTVVRAIGVLWPSFLVASLAEFAVFAFVDPASVHLPSGETLSRPAVYPLAFFGFWALGALSSAMTLFLTGAEPASPPARATAP